MTLRPRNIAYPALARRGLKPRLTQAYAEFCEEHGATHELTIALGLHPRSFDPETEFKPLMTVVARELAQRLRGIPKRQRRFLSAHDDRAIFMAGFYEPYDRFGSLFPHWHGVLALRNGEEALAREVLAARAGKDETTDLGVRREPREDDVSILRLHGRSGPITLEPNFHFQPLTNTSDWMGYATKQVRDDDPTFWTTLDFLNR